MMSPAMIKAENVHKSYGKFEVLKGINLVVPAGTIFALLGPNGAGKTTLIRIFTTLLKPDRGTITVGYYDVVKEPQKLRETIGLAGQYAAIDENLTGLENLEMVGRLYHFSKKESRKKAEDLLERFNLTDAGKRVAKNYSGGMRRRLDLAASLVAAPPVLFLDEPTTGLDPQSRIALWETIRELVKEGTTVLLTTQYMEEADQLAENIAVIDHGKIIAEGTSDELKTRVGGDVLEVQIEKKELLEKAAEILKQLQLGEPTILHELKSITLPVKETRSLIDAVRALDSSGIKILNIAVHRPTMDDVFIALTGHKT